MADLPLRVLHVTPCIYPATRWGGPAYSVYALCNALSARPDILLHVATTDAAGPVRHDRLDISQAIGRLYPNYAVTFVHRIFGHSVAPQILPLVWREASRSDIVHVTGTYNFTTLITFLVAKLLKKPLIWSPRGALQASAEWNENSRPRIKKIWEAMLLALAPAQTCMHVTADAEKMPSQQRMRGMEAVLIPNGIDIPPELTPVSATGARRIRLLFLSRVHPKKGIDVLLKALAQLGEGYELDIYGEGDDAYIDRLKIMAQALGVAERISFHGHVDGAAKAQAYAASDILVLPTHSENFGLVIAEALAAGRPVVTTKYAPWSGLETHDCGRWVELDVGEIAAAIDDVARSDINAMGLRGRAWMKAEFDWENVAKQMSDAYRHVARTPHSPSS